MVIKLPETLCLSAKSEDTSATETYVSAKMEEFFFLLLNQTHQLKQRGSITFPNQIRDKDTEREAPNKLVQAMTLRIQNSL